MEKKQAGKIAVLLMAHGGPDSLDDIEPFLSHIMRHRTSVPPSPELVDVVTDRYRQIGGKSPLLEITRQQAKRLETELNRRTDRFRVYVGMRHWSPFIKEVIPQIMADTPEHLVAISMAPQHSRMSVGAYIKAAKEALSGHNPSVSFVASWHDQPLLLDAFSKKVKERLMDYPEAIRPSVSILFTAHSLPESILADGDLYPAHLEQTMNGVVKRLEPLVSPKQVRFAYQSQGMSGGKWLGPTVESVLQEIAEKEGKHVLIAPIGFVADHIEILYDIDILYKKVAEERGITLARIESLNTAPLFIQALASVVHANLPT